MNVLLFGIYFLPFYIYFDSRDRARLCGGNNFFQFIPLAFLTDCNVISIQIKGARSIYNTCCGGYACGPMNVDFDISVLFYFCFCSHIGCFVIPRDLAKPERRGIQFYINGFPVMLYLARNDKNVHMTSSRINSIMFCITCNKTFDKRNAIIHMS